MSGSSLHTYNGVTYDALGNVTSFEPPAKQSGGGGTITADKIILGGWIFHSKPDGVYVTTPGGVETKMELIDFRQVPVPPTPPLAVQPEQPSVKPAAVGTGNEGAGLGDGNFTGGGGYTGSPTTAEGSPVRPVGDLNQNNDTAPGGGINPGAGPGYQPLSDNGKATLAKATPPMDSNTNFLNSLDTLCKSLNVPVDNMVMTMWIESKINPKAINASAGASGLNQIMPKTAGTLGYTIEQIRAMSSEEQMAGPTTKYFQAGKKYLPSSPSMVDLYLLNFFPAAVGKPDDFICGYPQADGSGADKTPGRDAVAKANAPFKGPSGYVTVGSVKDWMAKKFGS